MPNKYPNQKDPIKISAKHIKGEEFQGKKYKLSRPVNKNTPNQLSRGHLPGQPRSHKG